MTFLTFPATVAVSYNVTAIACDHFLIISYGFVAEGASHYLALLMTSTKRQAKSPGGMDGTHAMLLSAWA
eukprot:scaffold18552_cov263-Skeletonema_menzelii.AAC.1